AINVHINGPCTAIKNCRRRRHKRHGDRDHLVAGANSGREQREVKRRGSAVDRHAMFDIAIRSKTFFERNHLWAEHKMCAIDDLRYCSIDFRLYSLVLLFQVKKRYHGPASRWNYRTLACVIRSRSLMTRAGT